MAAPTDIVRSYAGGAPIAYLTGPMGPSDTSFTISPTTGWETPDSQPLGTDGPFTIDVDRGLATEEKILCTSVNLSTGLVEVYNTGGFNGRGYDQTTATTHTPSGGSPLSGSCQVVLTAVECAEFNRAVTYLLGTAGGSPSSGQLLTWSGSAPQWADSGSLSGNPAGRLYQTSNQNILTTTTTGLGNLAEDFLIGGVTQGSNHMTVPVAGVYLVTLQVLFTDTAAGSLFEGAILVNSAVLRSAQTFSGAGDSIAVRTSDLINLAANSVVAANVAQNTGSSQATTSGTNCTFLSLALQSTA